MKVTITTGDLQLQEVLELLNSAPKSVLPAIARGLSTGAAEVLGLAQKERFRGRGPFPVSQNRLGVRTGLLLRTLNVTKPQLSGNSLSVRMGSNVSYFAAHEFGFRGAVSVRQSQVRAFTNNNAFGNNQISVLAHSRRAHQRNVNIPARAPLGTAIDQHSVRAIGDAVERELNKLLDENE